MNDAALKQELLLLLNDPEFEAYKKNVYCCLASLCSNTSDYALFDFLLIELKKLYDESTIVSILSRFEKLAKPVNIDISTIKRYIFEGSRDECNAAIKALSNSKNPEVEYILLEEFKISDTNVKSRICSTLQTLGTTKSIPILKDAFKKTREPFLRLSIEYTIKEIEKIQVK